MILKKMRNKIDENKSKKEDEVQELTEHSMYKSPTFKRTDPERKGKQFRRDTKAQQHIDGVYIGDGNEREKTEGKKAAEE
jgi:hypothetical protein